MSTQDASTWHYGVIARWWAEFNTDGPEIGVLPAVRRGGPARARRRLRHRAALLPYLRDGLDVDGCDVSPDMLRHCREAAEREGLSPNLYAQAIHELDLPRRYRTIYVCGGFGLGSTREQDVEGLRRLHDHLEPGGLLVLDNEVPYADALAVAVLAEGEARGAAAPPPPAGQAAAGRGRRRVRAAQPRPRLRPARPERDAGDAGVHVARRRARRRGHARADDEALLPRRDRAAAASAPASSEVEVRGHHNDAEPTGDDDFLVFLARKAAAAGTRWNFRVQRDKSGGRVRTYPSEDYHE